VKVLLPHIWQNHVCTWNEWNNFQAEPRRRFVWRLGFALGPPRILTALPRHMAGGEGSAAKEPEPRSCPFWPPTCGSMLAL